MKKFVKIILWFLGGIVVLLLLLVVVIQTTWAKNLLRDKLQAYIAKKTKTEFVIGSIDYSLPKWVELNGVFMRDLSKDTLLYGGKIKVDIAMLKLISGKYEVDKVVLDNVYINLVRKEKDTTYNYQFIIDAFASKNPSPKDTSSSFSLSLNDVSLKNTRFNQLDYYQGSLMRLAATDFQLDFKTFDINKMRFDLNKAYADGVNFNMQVLKALPAAITNASAKSNPSSLPIINAKSIIVKNTTVFYNDKPDSLYTNDHIGLMEADKLSNTKNANTFIGKTFILSNSSIEFRNATAAQTVTVKKDTITATVANGSSINLVMDDIQVLQNNIVYDNTSKPVQKEGLDYFHLGISNLNLVAKATKYINGNIETNIQRFSFKDKSGFSLDSLSGNVKVDSNFISIKNMVLRTPNSSINAEAIVYPSSFGTPNTNKGKLPDNDIIINRTVIGRKDLDLLAESLTAKYKAQLDELGNLVVDAHIKGDAKRLMIQQLVMNATRPNTLSLQMSGIIENATDTKNLKYNTNIKNLSLSQKIINPFIKDLKQKISLPPMVNINGTLVGDMSNVNANVSTNTAYGYAAIKAKLNHFDKPSNMVYDITLNAKNLETGKWIGSDSTLGKLNGDIAVKGSGGFDIKNNHLKALAAIKSFRYNKDTIENINVDAVMNQGAVSGKASIKDKLIGISVNGKANIHDDYPTIDAVIDVAHADLLALGLTKDTINVTALTKIKVNDASPDGLDAMIRIDSAVVTQDGQKIAIDSSVMVAFVRNDSTFIQVLSPFGNANIKSTVYYNDIPLLLQEVMDKVMPSTIATTTKTEKSKPAPQGNIQAEVIIKPNATYSAFLPSVVFDQPIGITANITNKNQDSAIKMKVNVPGLTVSSMRIGNLQGNVLGKGDSINFNIGIDTVSASSVMLYDASIKGSFSKNNIAVALVTKDDNKKDQFKLSVAAKPNNVQGYDVSLGKDLMLSRQNWTVNEQNLVRTSTAGFDIQNFDINLKEEKISIHNETELPTSPIDVNIDNFKLSTLTAAINQDSMQVDGLLNVAMKVSDLKNPLPTVDGTVKLDSIIFANKSVGNIDIKAESADNKVTVTGKMTGNGNNVDIDASYSTDKIDAKINLNPINLASIEPFTFGNLARSQGTITGPINITGTVSDPKWNGELTFNKVQTTAVQFGTFMKIDNQKIAFTYPTIEFNNFTIADSTNKILTVNGKLTQTANEGFVSDLSIDANGFRAMNSSSVDNNMLYGIAVVDAKATVKGKVTAPDIAGSVAIKNGTQITFVRPTTPPSTKDRDGVIEFVKMDTIANILKEYTSQEALALQKKQSGGGGSLNYNLNLSIEKEAKLDVIIDPITRDELQVQGDAEINAGVNPNGDVALTGTYNLHKGSYQLNYQFIKRKFELLDSSSITFSGDPEQANADITAAYDISTDAYDLVSGEISGGSASELEIYKRKVPFQVLLKIKGKITAPQLSFDIVVQDKAVGVSSEMQSTIDNKLQQLRTDQAAMNKQVFALLVLNKFIGDQSSDFFAGAGGSSNILANASVSNFLNGALNQIASNLIKGVDVEINLKNNDDDPNNVHTDLGVALGKSFLNDRLTVSVGKSFTVQGDDPTINNSNDNGNTQFIPDVNTAYKLSKDGRYMLRTYRRNEYDAVLDGYFIETGLAFSFTVDYNKLQEILHKKK